MRKLLTCTVATVGLLTIGLGCATTGTKTQSADREQVAVAKTGGESGAVIDNPTTRDGRGEPDLADLHRHAAWIYIDGEEGHFIEKDGNPQIQWTIHTLVSRSPTFRVECYEPLLGSPKDFSCALQTQEAFDGSVVVYGIRAKEGKFVPGKEYSLLEPGEDFIILDKSNGDAEIKKIPLLAPGTYGIVGGVRNARTEKEALAVTYFTVGADEPDATEPEPEAEEPTTETP